MKQAIITLLAVLCAQQAVALYEDQAGTYDWYKAYMGPVVNAAFHRSKPRLYISTQQGIAGALNLRDGSIAWRHKLSDPAASSSSLLVESTPVFVTLTGKTVSAWDHVEGLHKWTNNDLGITLTPASSSLALLPGQQAQIAVIGAGQLAVLDAATGSKSWAVQVSGEQASGAAVTRMQATASTLHTYTYTPGSYSVHAQQLTHAGASAAAAVTLTAEHALSAVSSAGPAGLATISQDGQHICTSTVSSSAAGETTASSSSMQCTSLSSLAAWLPAAAATAVRQQQLNGAITSGLQLARTATGWALASGNPASPGVVLLSAGGDGALKAAATFPAASAISSPELVGSTEHMAVVELKADGAVVVQYIATGSGKVAASETFARGSWSEKLAPGVTAPGVRDVVLGSFRKKDNTHGFRALLVWSDERVSLLQQGVVVWSRDEALGGVRHALFSDLPPGKAAAAGIAAGAQPADANKSQLSQFIQYQLLSAKVQFKLASAEEVLEHGRMRSALSDKNLPTRDARGFRRSLVVSTSSGKVAALHNGDGHVMWARPGDAELGPAQHLLTWRRYHDLTHAPQVATLHSVRGSSGASALVTLDAYTGKELERMQLPYPVHKLISLGWVAEGDHSEQQLFLAVSAATDAAAATAPQVHLLPDTPLARSHFAAHYRSLYFWLDTSSSEDARAGKAPALQGFGFDGAAAAALSAGQGGAAATSTWSLTLPEPVLAVAAADPTEPLHTSVKVLGDRSMKYKYLNPNTLVVVSGMLPGAALPPDEAEFLEANIYLVDAVTGAVRHQQSAPGCRGPATALLFENLAVVQLWDATSARFQVTSLELFDASERTFSVLDHLFNPNATAPQSSFSPPPLEVLTASFYTRMPAKSLLTTRTRAGITSKLILALTHSDQVYTLDARFVDPRRPRHQKLTAAEQEERLLPYMDTLPVMAPAFASYNKQVLSLQHSISAPSRLESTSLLFSWGVDLQYTRLLPAKGFDSLDDDFSYGLLLVALVGLTIASVMMHWFTKSQTLKAKWQ